MADEPSKDGDKTPDKSADKPDKKTAPDGYGAWGNPRREPRRSRGWFGVS